MKKHIVFVEASGTGAGEMANHLAKQKGCFVTLFSRSPESYPEEILKNVDQTIKCETNDADVVVRLARELTKVRPIHGITTTADFHVPQACKAAQELGLPTMTYQAALGVRNKYKMRLKLEKSCPYLNPPFGRVKNIEEALETANKWGYPFIAKPQDLNDSIDVKLIKNEEDLRTYMKIAQKWDLNAVQQPITRGVLLEGYIDGQEFSLETMQHKGEQIKLIGINIKFLASFVEGYFAEMGNTFHTYSEEFEMLFAAVSEALESLNVDCGVTHTECRIQNGAVKILEVNPRLIGDMNCYVIEYALGINPVQAVIDTSLGFRGDWKPTQNNHVALWGICMPRTGQFLGIKNLEELKRVPGVVKIGSIKKIGERCQAPPLSNEDILARIVTTAETPGKALELAKNIANQAKVYVTD
jgi:biotin carboxylase